MQGDVAEPDSADTQDVQEAVIVLDKGEHQVLLRDPADITQILASAHKTACNPCSMHSRPVHTIAEIKEGMHSKGVKAWVAGIVAYLSMPFSSA